MLDEASEELELRSWSLRLNFLALRSDTEESDDDDDDALSDESSKS